MAEYDPDQDDQMSPEEHAIWKKYDKLCQEAPERAVREAFASTLTMLESRQIEGVNDQFAGFVTDVLVAATLTGDYEKGITLLEDTKRENGELR